MKTLSIPAILAGLLLVAATTSCKDKQPETKVLTPVPTPIKEARDPPLTLVSYEVPKNQGGQVKQILDRVFRGVKHKIAARAALSPDGQLVVVAPASIQAGVKNMIEKMATRKAPQPASIEITYWLVVGRPANTTTVPESLDKVKKALTSVAGSQGKMEFALLERLRVRSLADHPGRTRGTHARVRQVVSMVGGKIVGDLDVSVMSGKSHSQLETRVVLDETKQLVLGEAGFRPPADLWPLRTGTTNKRSTLFYVIQTRVTR